MERIVHKRLAIEIFYAALKSVDPYESVKFYIDRIRTVYQNGDFSRLIVVGFGKAAYPMAKAMEDNLIDLIDTGIVITKYGHIKIQSIEHRAQNKDIINLNKIKVIEAGHPVPDENGLKATQEIIKLLKGSDKNTLIVCLISGGGSALLISPYEGITLDEKQKITGLLLRSGANIYELNTVRKHISKVKGGRLAEITYPAKIISLIISDVVGDRLDVIASGPTSPDLTTYNDTLNVLEKYRLIERSPQSILEVLYRGADGLIPETPKEGNTIFEKVENIIIGGNKKALDAAKERAEALSLHAEIISSEISGEARDVGKGLAAKAIEMNNVASRGERLFAPTLCLISGGETTVSVKGKGIGGRNMELALAFAMEIEGINGITLLSAGTDGTDGPTDAAGAIVDGNTVAMAKAIGINPEEYLRNNDSYNFFKKINALFVTGPTRTNVMDIQIVIIE